MAETMDYKTKTVVRSRVEPKWIEISALQRAILVELTTDAPGNVEIGRRLGISENMVKYYLKTINEETGARTRGHLIVMLLRRQVCTRVKPETWADLPVVHSAHGPQPDAEPDHSDVQPG